MDANQTEMGGKNYIQRGHCQWHPLIRVGKEMLGHIHRWMPIRPRWEERIAFRENIDRGKRNPSTDQGEKAKSW